MQIGVAADPPTGGRLHAVRPDLLSRNDALLN